MRGDQRFAKRIWTISDRKHDLSVCHPRNLLRFSRLYGVKFRGHFSVLHAPSFNLAQTPPLLLLAIMLVGACYANKQVSTAHITKLAMRLLMLIVNQPVRFSPLRISEVIKFFSSMKYT